MLTVARNIVVDPLCEARHHAILRLHIYRRGNRYIYQHAPLHKGLEVPVVRIIPIPAINPRLNDVETERLDRIAEVW